MLVENPELYNPYLQGLEEPQSLDEKDILKFDLLLGTYLSCMMQTYFLHTEGALADGIRGASQGVPALGHAAAWVPATLAALGSWR